MCLFVSLHSCLLFAITNSSQFPLTFHIVGMYFGGKYHKMSIKYALWDSNPRVPVTEVGCLYVYYRLKPLRSTTPPSALHKCARAKLTYQALCRKTSLDHSTQRLGRCECTGQPTDPCILVPVTSRTRLHSPSLAFTRQLAASWACSPRAPS